MSIFLVKVVLVSCTRGYMAPEYIHRGIITKKLDIFSLGVILIEIMTGRKDYPYETETSSQKFTELVLKNWRNRLENASRYAFLETDCQQIRRCIEIGLACVKVEWEERPTTCQIIKLLHGLEGAECNNERLAINTSLIKVTHTVDESSSGVDDACNELGSCNASAMECSENSDSESEIFRVKRRSTMSEKPASDTKISNSSEQQVLRRLKKRRLKKLHPDIQRESKRLEESNHSSVIPVRTSLKSTNSASSSRDTAAELRPKRVKIWLPSSTIRQIEQRGSGQRFARDDKSLGYQRTF